MKWGQIDNVENDKQLLYWVLLFILEPYFDDPIDHWLKKILIPNGGLGGDPGWEMERLSPYKDSQVFYRIWADPEVSGLKSDTKIYSDKEVKKALYESLLALKNKYQNRANEIEDVINRYAL